MLKNTHKLKINKPFRRLIFHRFKGMKHHSLCIIHKNKLIYQNFYTLFILFYFLHSENLTCFQLFMYYIFYDKLSDYLKFRGDQPMGLTIVMDEKTKKYLETKEALTISPLELNGCCVPNAEVDVQFTTPEQKNPYNHITDQGIPIYIDKRLDFKKDTVVLKVKGFKPFTTLQVEGLVRF